MSITRTTVTDDDGSGTTGTIANNAWLQALFDTLDGRWSVQTITSTGAQNNLSIAEADLVIFNNASLVTISGLVAPASPAKAGKPVFYVSTGAGQVDLLNQSGLSTAANRIVTGTATTISLAPGTGRGWLVYESGTSQWRVINPEQGAAIAYTPTWGNTGTANSLGNGTLTGTYYVIGRRCFYHIVLTWGSTTASGNGNWTFTTPFTTDSFGPQCAEIVVHDNSPAGDYRAGAINSSTTVLTPVTNASPVAAFTTTSPITWTTSDVCNLSGWFFLA